MTAGNLGTVSVSIVPTLDVAALTTGFDVAVRTAVADALEAAARDLRGPARSPSPRYAFVSAVRPGPGGRTEGALDRETDEIAFSLRQIDVDDLNSGADDRDGWLWTSPSNYSDLKEL